MTPAGIILMSVSTGTVLVVFTWCLWRVLRAHRAAGELAKVEPVGESQVDQR